MTPPPTEDTSIVFRTIRSPIPLAQLVPLVVSSTPVVPPARIGLLTVMLLAATCSLPLPIVKVPSKETGRFPKSSAQPATLAPQLAGLATVCAAIEQEVALIGQTRLAFICAGVWVSEPFWSQQISARPYAGTRRSHDASTSAACARRRNTDGTALYMTGSALAR